jgi:hypothetical protein
MTSTELEYAERRMQQRWYDLVTAEREGVAPQALERKFNAYMLAVEDYNRRSAALSSTNHAHPRASHASQSEPDGHAEEQEPAVPVTSSPEPSLEQKTPRVAGRRKKAS